jgi:hypothetical protein
MNFGERSSYDKKSPFSLVLAENNKILFLIKKQLNNAIFLYHVYYYAKKETVVALTH